MATAQQRDGRAAGAERSLDAAETPVRRLSAPRVPVASFSPGS
jgi:hypothetical protein